MTVDFASTIKTVGESSVLDAYQRPVQWILTSVGDDDSRDHDIKHLVVISPYEAHELQPDHFAGLLREKVDHTLLSPHTDLWSLAGGDPRCTSVTVSLSRWLI